jgi:F-type H+-transporting ATPase subunit delta
MNAKLGLQKELRNLLAVLIKNDRIGDVKEVAAAYRAEMQERQGVRSVEIVTARELSEKDRAGWWPEWANWRARRFRPASSWTTSILGGTVVRIGSTVYDGSVRGRLDRLKEALDQWSVISARD